MSDSLDQIDVLILVGGKGTRLHSVINDRPKPMADINGRPFLDRLIEYVSSFGHNRIILCAGHLAEYLRKYYLNAGLPQEIVLSVEETPLGTGGAVKNAEKLIHSETFFILNGDSFCPVDLTGFKTFHGRKKAKISMAVAQSADVRDYGLIGFDYSQQIVSFEEKKHQPEKGYINAGVYLFNKSILADIPKNIQYSLEDDFYPSIIGEKFFAYVVDGNLVDIGTPERYSFAKEYFSD